MIYTFDGIKNVRELGNIETLSGQHVKKDLLFRTGELAKASERDIDLIKNKYKVKAFIDFRDKYKSSSDWFTIFSKGITFNIFLHVSIAIPVNPIDPINL